MWTKTKQNWGTVQTTGMLWQLSTILVARLSASFWSPSMGRVGKRRDPFVPGVYLACVCLRCAHCLPPRSQVQRGYSRNPVRVAWRRDASDASAGGAPGGTRPTRSTAIPYFCHCCETNQHPVACHSTSVSCGGVCYSANDRASHIASISPRWVKCTARGRRGPLTLLHPSTEPSTEFRGDQMSVKPADQSASRSRSSLSASSGQRGGSRLTPSRFAPCPGRTLAASVAVKVTISPPTTLPNSPAAGGGRGRVSIAVLVAVAVADES